MSYSGPAPYWWQGFILVVVISYDLLCLTFLSPPGFVREKREKEVDNSFCHFCLIFGTVTVDSYPPPLK